MNMTAVLRIAGDDADLATTIMDFLRAEEAIHRELRGLDEMAGEIRRALAVSHSETGRAVNAGTTLARLTHWLGRREVLLERLNHAKVDMFAVRAAGGSRR